MKLQMGDITFDDVSYDATADVLYLSVGSPARAAHYDATNDGHHVRYDEHGRVVGVTIVNAKWLLDRRAEIDTPGPIDYDELKLAVR